MRPRIRHPAGLAVTALAFAACGGSDGHELVGYTRDPAPAVDAVALPDVGRGGGPFSLRGPEDGLLLVYFGYTNCPDACPTTLANVRGAFSDLDPDEAADVELAMVTIDPARDADVLAAYVQDFVPGAHALATDDDTELRAVADRFGVSYSVAERPDGEIEVAHTDNLFAVDDAGTLVLTWPSGVGRDDLAGDLEQLLRDHGHPGS
jgi:protein SCO1/2